MGIILAGDRSGTGKTTLTLALLSTLKKRGKRVQSFKVGPDYIDPMFHAAVTGRPCYNLDPVLTSEAYVQKSYHKHCNGLGSSADNGAGADYAVVEGVMGLFDGATGVDDTASTAHIARLLGLPVLLAVDCGQMSRSLAALVQGYRNFDPQVNVVGVILNRVGSDRHLQLLSDALAAIKMPILGVFRREKDIQLPDRHLGLVPTGEVDGFDVIADRLAGLGERCFDWEKLEPFLGVGYSESKPGYSTRTPKANDYAQPSETAQPSGVDLPKAHLSKQNVQTRETTKKMVRIAIARDSAFNFYYPDNFEMLNELGAELVDWSPLADEKLTEADGLYFGGGFPEVFAAQLSSNKAMMADIKKAISNGIPTYAECGGLMYLSEQLVDFEGVPWPMVGVIPQRVKMGGRLALGYRKAEALTQGPLLEQGQIVVGHEFHKSSVLEKLSQPTYTTQRYWGGETPDEHEGYCRGTVHASYVHLHWGHRPEIAQRFIQHCTTFKETSKR
ncbi:MAG: cobyrinate a,c-diamide synthase [Cyanobacteria bacterium P01_F01_bin.53]